MKPLTLEETALKEEMKERCLAKGQYIDEKAKDKFKMLCHLEDFEIQYWELQQENKKLKEQLSVTQTNEETFRLEMVDITKILGLDEHTIFDDVKAYIKILKDNWNKLKKDLELVVDYGLGDESSKWDKIYGEYAKSTLKFMQELEQGSDSNE
jgi:hypothetical protein